MAGNLICTRWSETERKRCKRAKSETRLEKESQEEREKRVQNIIASLDFIRIVNFVLIEWNNNTDERSLIKRIAEVAI